MKTTLKIALSTFAIAFVIFLIGCSNNNSPVAANDTIDPSTAIMINNTSDLSFSDPEGQFSNDNGDTPFCTPNHGHHGPIEGAHGMKDSSKFGQLRMILPCLLLTADQLTQLRSLMTDFRTAVQTIMTNTRALELPFRTAADVQVKAIKDQVVAGTMTREDARSAINAIRTQLIADTKTFRETARTAITDLQNALLTQIRSILTVDQQVIWDTWMTVGTIPCRPPHHGGMGHR